MLNSFSSIEMCRSQIDFGLGESQNLKKHAAHARYPLLIEHVAPSMAELTTRYDHIAPNWSTIMRRFGFPHAYNHLFARLKADGRLDALTNRSQVLDCGIGAGDLSLAMNVHFRPSPRVIGIDISKKMLNQAQTRLSQAGVTARMHRHDVRQLPFEDNRFDLVMAAHTLEHLPNPLDGLLEMVRVLPPGKPLLIVITQRHLLSSWLQVRWYLKSQLPHEIAPLMESVGLKDVQIYPLQGPLWCRWMSFAMAGVKASITA